MQKHRTSAAQTITVILHKPARSGIDSYHLLIDRETDDNVKAVRVKN